jgi:uncharacterized coiled-coil protein SlyX
VDPLESRLLAERLRHTLDLLNGRFSTLETRLSHDLEMANVRLGSLEQRQSDHEARLRALTETVVQLTTSAGLAQAAQAAFALILSALAAWLGRR